MTGYLGRAREVASKIKVANQAPGILTERKEMPGGPSGSETKVKWPRKCLDSEKRFGKPHAKFYPLLETQVLTPLGSGILWRVFANSIGIILKSDLEQVTFFQKSDGIYPEIRWELLSSP